METVIALFDSEAEADSAFAGLDQHGIGSESIGVLVSRDLYDHYYDETSFPSDVEAGGDSSQASVAEVVDDDVVEESTKGAAGGAVGGATAGATAGYLAAAGALAVPGVGPFLAAGALGSTLIGAGAGAAAGGATGGILGAIFGANEDDERQRAEDDDYDRTAYHRGLEEGGVVVAVETSQAQSEVVAQRLRQMGASEVDVHRDEPSQ